MLALRQGILARKCRLETRSAELGAICFPLFAGTLAWLNNFLSRSGSLRGQLQALQGVKDRSRNLAFPWFS